MKRKILLAVLCAVCAVFAAAAVACNNIADNPSGTHTHSYAWTDNGDGTHKRHCSATGCDAPDIDFEAHVWGADNKCEKCKAVKGNDPEPPAPHKHEWAQAWQSDEAHHWHDCTAAGCTVTDNSQKDGYGAHDFTDGDCVCGKHAPHKHEWAQAWQSDEAHHWHDCTAAGCTVTDNSQKDGYGAHDFTNGKCVCGASDATTGIEYALNDDGDGYYVKSVGTATDANIVIASEYDGKPVIGIGNGAFTDCEFVTGVKMYAGIKYIESNAFSGCSSLASVNIPIGVQSIGSYAFAGCASMASVEIPNGVTGIGDMAFYGCASLKNAVMPNSVTSVGRSAFANCKLLESVSLPFVGKKADSDNFLGYLFGAANAGNNGDYVPTSLKTVEITGGGAIGYRAFENCFTLETVVLSKDITRIPEGAFKGCSSLASVTLPFVGDCAKTYSELKQYPFGYIFGRDAYTGGAAVRQPYHDTSLSSDTTVTYYIPTTLKNVTVLGGNILSGAFYNCGGIRQITLGEGITSIENCAFTGCTSVTKLTVPDSVTRINGKPFSSALTELVIGDGLTSVSDYALSNCSGLVNLTLPRLDSYIGKLFGGYNNTSDDPQNIVPDSLRSVTVTGGDSVPYVAFRGCNRITSVTLGDGIKTIGANAFYGCTALHNVTLPNDLTKIEWGAFYDCSSLTDITLPNGITEIGSGAFEGCDGLRGKEYDNAYYLGSVERPYLALFKVKSKETVTCAVHDETVFILTKAFSGGNIMRITFSSSVEVIEDGAFENCSGLKSIVIPDNIKSIWSEAFALCGELVSVTLPSNLTLIDSRLFYNCGKLESIVIPEGVEIIGEKAFAYCTALKSVTIPASVTQIDDGAFYSATGVGSFLYSIENVYYKGDIAGWCNIRGLENLTTYVKLEHKTFFGEKELVGDLVIPDGVTTIPQYAFRGCMGIQSVTVADSVKSIGEAAFNYCRSIKSITLPFVGEKADGTGNVLFGWIFGKDSFTGKYNDGVPGNISRVILSASCVGIGESAFSGCDDITEIVLPATLSKIGFGAFSKCASTLYIYYSGDIAGWCGIGGLANLTGRELSSYSSPVNRLFIGGKEITELSVPSGVTSIASGAFGNCPALLKVTIPESVTVMGSGVFRGNTFAIYCEAPSKPDGWEDDWNYYCIVVWDSNNNDADQNGNVHVLSGGIRFRLSNNEAIVERQPVTAVNANIPASITYKDKTYPVTTIDESAFAGCREITSVTVPESVTYINRYAFAGCYSLETFNFNAISCKTYSDDPSLGSSLKLTTVNIGLKVTTIPKGIFRDCSYITSIVIPDNVKIIGPEAFYRCSKLTDISIGNGVKAVGYDAFRDCGNLSYKTYDNAYYLGNDLNPHVVLMKAKNQSITSCTINENAKVIYSNAFLNCKSLAELILPSGITDVGVGAFGNCYALKHITENGALYLGTADNDHFLLYDVVYNTKSLEVHADTKIISGEVDGKSLTTLTMPKGIICIGDMAFVSCSSLVISYNGTMAEWNGIYKGVYWKKDSRSVTVECLDGSFAV